MNCGNDMVGPLTKGRGNQHGFVVTWDQRLRIFSDDFVIYLKKKSAVGRIKGYMQQSEARCFLYPVLKHCFQESPKVHPLQKLRIDREGRPLTLKVNKPVACT